MSLRRLAAAWRADQRGSTIIEFAALAPVICGLLLGILQLGIQMQNYNALRSATADIARYTEVEYQKTNRLTNDQIRTRAVAFAVNPPYSLDIDDLAVTIASGPSEMSGATKITVTLAYQLPNYLGFLNVSAPRLVYTRPIYVPTS